MMILPTMEEIVAVVEEEEHGTIADGCIYVYIYICIYTYMYIYIKAYKYMYIYAYIYVYINKSIYKTYPRWKR